eukprot:198642-Ditylum_brightwellii.AAC.1
MGGSMKDCYKIWMRQQRYMRLIGATSQDSGSTGNYLTKDGHCIKKRQAANPISVKAANGLPTASTYTCDLDLPSIPPEAKDSNVLSDLTSHSLVSVGKLCNNNCNALFKKDKFQVIKDSK